MRRSVTALAALAAIAAPQAATAATIVVYTDPMTLERRTVVVDPDGPDRLFLCVLPPGQAGCQEMKIRPNR